MPRTQESELYSALISSKLYFLPTEEVSLESIYELVKRTFPDLCDDDFFCFECCRGGGKRPEWHHRVRAALGILQDNGVVRRVRYRVYQVI